MTLYFIIEIIHNTGRFEHVINRYIKEWRTIKRKESSILVKRSRICNIIFYCSMRFYYNNVVISTIYRDYQKHGIVYIHTIILTTENTKHILTLMISRNIKIRSYEHCTDTCVYI